MKIGFIGLGVMGSGIALNILKAGYDLVVNDIVRDTAALHLQEGGKWVDTPREVAESCEVIFTSLPGPEEVEAVALGEHGILKGASPEKAYFDLSTNSPALIRRIHDKFIEKGVHVLDAPLSGGARGVSTRKLAIMVGGDKRIYQKYKVVLSSIGNKVNYIGPIGSGSIVKLVHNCASTIIYQVIAETFTMGVKAGIDPLTLWKAVRECSAGRRRTFDGAALRLLPGPLDPPGFALNLNAKDVALAVEVGREFEVPMRYSNLALAELTEAIGRGWGDRDMGWAMCLQEERSGVQVRASKEQIKDVLDKD